MNGYMNLLPTETQILTEAFNTVKSNLFNSCSMGPYDSVLGYVIEALDENQWRHSFNPFPSFQWAHLSMDSILINFPSLKRSLVVTVHSDWPCTDYAEKHFSTWFPLVERKLNYDGLVCATLYLIQKWVDECVVANPLSVEGDIEVSKDRLSKIPRLLLEQVQKSNLYSFKCNLL